MSVKAKSKDEGKKQENERRGMKLFFSFMVYLQGYKYYLVCKKNSHDPLKNLVRVSQTNNICHINNLFACFQLR